MFKEKSQVYTYFDYAYMTFIYGEETLLGTENLPGWIRKVSTICGNYNFCFWRRLDGGDLPYEICAICVKTKMVYIFYSQTVKPWNLQICFNLE